MGTTRSDLSAWFDEGVERGATHMVVVCDTFRHEDYTIYVMPGYDVREVVAKHGVGENKDMSRVMEVYAMHLDKDMQLSEGRSFHFESPGEESSPESEMTADSADQFVDLLTKELMKPLDHSGVEPDWGRVRRDLNEVADTLLTAIGADGWKNICAAREADAERVENYMMGSLIRAASADDAVELAVTQVLSKILRDKR